MEKTSNFQQYYISIQVTGTCVKCLFGYDDYVEVLLLIKEFDEKVSVL